jgi:hypothetical protein
MHGRCLSVTIVLWALSVGLTSTQAAASKNEDHPAGQLAKVYVPYEELKRVFETEQQGVFLPYEQFRQLWRAAQGKPRDISEAPFDHLISTARFTGTVKKELANLRLELTIDIMTAGWVEVPIGLGEVGVSKAQFIESGSTDAKPLLRVVEGQYILVTKGKGRYVVALDFVSQLKTEPGLHVLTYRIPSASVTTMELLIPEENLKVDVEPMVAATTSQVEAEGAKATRLQAFLGSAKQVRLSWKPKTEAAPELKPVIICEQFQHINVGEALISYEVDLNYTIRRGAVESFSVKLPPEFRITDVSGANIAKWSVLANGESTGSAADLAIVQTSQELNVSLFSPAKDRYSLTVKMERFLQQAQADVPLAPIVTDGVLRRTGLIGLTASRRRLVSVKNVVNLARVDTGRLPGHLHNQPGVTAYRFIAADYSGTIAIETALPRITVNQRWMLGVESDRLELRANIHYKVERTGVFELTMNLPDPWQIDSVGPDQLVDDHQLTGSGQARILHVLLKAEKTGEFDLQLTAHAERPQPELPVDFSLPLADAENLQLYQGQLTLLLADQLRAEVQQLQQLQAIPLGQTQRWAELSPVMAFEFRAIDRAQPAGAQFKIAVKPPQVSAVVHRLVNIQRGSVEQEAVVHYRVRYAPIDTFYLKMPQALADAGVQITGSNIKEKPRIEQLPPDQRTDGEPADAEAVEWAYYKIVLQSKHLGDYRLSVRHRRSFQPGQLGQPTTVDVEPILAAGKLSDQYGHIAIAKAEMLAVGEPQVTNLMSADPGSAADLPWEDHRSVASLAFKYNAPPFELSLPIVLQKEALVFTTIVTGVVVEQVWARDGVLNTHAAFMLQTGKGDRLPVTLPDGAELTAVLLNGDEAPVEMGLDQNQRIVRLPHSAGQVSKFVLEISYGLRDVAPSGLTAPALEQEIPVQQSLWRLWIPRSHYLLGHNRVFARLEGSSTDEMRRMLARGQPSSVEFKLSDQGKVFDFVRQGPPGSLGVIVAGKEAFSIVVWGLVIVAGALMLRLGGFHRILIVSAGLLLAAVANLYLPLMIRHLVRTGVFAAVVVVLLWVGQWLFLRLPKIRQALPARVKPPAKIAEQPKATDKQKSEQNQE